MKILHFADLHLGVESYGSLDTATGLSTRLLDILKALDQVVEYAIENKVSLVVFCGDAYKSRDPTQTQQREFAKRLKRLSQQDIPVFLLTGNHDLPNAMGRATTLEIFDTLAVSNVYVGNRPDIYHIPTKQGYIQVAALPWLRRSALLSREEAKNLSLEQVNERLQEEMTSRLFDLIPSLDPNLPSLLAAHVLVATASPGSERTMIVGREPVLLPGNMAHPAFDYIALGHIHKHQVLSQEPPMVYVGSLERLDFSDEGEEKGFYIVEIEPGPRTGKRQVNYEFHQVKARRFVTIRVDIEAENADLTATVLKAIAQRSTEIEEAVVRVQVSLPEAMEASFQEIEIGKALKGTHHFFINREVKREARLRLGNWTAEELTPLEALNIYLETKKMSQSRRQTLLKYAEDLIAENADS